jgi:hypothetical protein
LRFLVLRKVQCRKTFVSWRKPQPLGPRLAITLLVLAHTLAFAADESTQKELRELRQENQSLQQQLARQQQLIESLSAKVAGIEQIQKARGESSVGESPSLAQKVSGQTKVNLSGQIAAGFFKTGSDGQFSKGEFRLDEARVFLDAKAWKDIYAFVELNVMTREAGDDGVRLGEAYLDFEHVLKWRGLDSLVNVRLGRFYIPFGEEYSVRYAIDNPLISHSLSDLWGEDEGIELYGSHGPLEYAFALQNGGHSAVFEGTSDKSVAARCAWQPQPWLRFSGSAMRTGDLSVQDESVSEMWFGNGLFRALGSPATTTRFHADLAEGDVQFLFSRGHIKLFGGAIRFDDNDRAANNRRDIYYYSAEGMWRFTKQFFGAARYSQILVDQGYPLVGHGNSSEYFDDELSDNLWRLSLGLGYTPNPNLVFKVEYTFERGREIGGERREHEDFFGAQAALRF